MSNLLLSNTSGQIDFTLRESYARLTGAFVGPSGNGGAGFTIQDGAKNTGIFVTNSCIQLCKNILDFKQNSNVRVLVPTGNCFVVSGNGSNFIFNQEGSVSFGSGINSNYKGIQSYSTNPSLTLTNSNGNCNQAIRFLNSGGSEIFNICQFSGCGTQLSGTCLGFFTNTGPSICLSGDYASFNAPINSNFNHFFSGTNYFSGDSYLRGNTTGSGIFCYFNSNVNCTGFDVNTRSFFKGNSIFSGSLCVSGCGSSINSQNFICSPTGYLNYLSGSCSIFECNLVNNLRVIGCSYLSGGAIFSGDSFYNITNINSTGIISERITGSCLRINCNSTISGCFLSGILSQNIFLRSCGLQICTTGSAGIGLSGNICLTGNINASGYSGFFNAICTLSTNPSFFNGPVCVTGSMYVGADQSPAYFCSQYITGCIIGSCALITGNCGLFTCFQQVNGSQISCFCSSGLNVGLSQTGVIKSINTSKAWGIISVCCGATIFCSGYNILSNQIYAQGTDTLARLIYAHGICFREPIKYPFVINFDVYQSGNSLITGHAVNSPGFSGVSTTTCTLAGNFGVAANYTNIPMGVQFYSASGRCSATSNLAPFVVGSTYSEIYFNLATCRGAGTTYAELTRCCANGIIHFNILGY